MKLPFPVKCNTVSQKHDWAKAHLEQLVNHERFRQYFAVHETEAWLLSSPQLFSVAVRKALAPKAESPEKVNFEEPPAKLLDRLYMSTTNRHYGKVRHGTNLFAGLDPEVAYSKCPYLRKMLDEMLAMAKDAGL